jgi:NAD(P)-dependent dehydrogenase (short-subunit alcohol dehydrogenase family)
VKGSDLFDLSGRVALVTGGNGGIGLGMAKGLTEAGAFRRGRRPKRCQGGGGAP